MENFPNKKVFLLSTNESFLDNELKYYLVSKKGLSNFKKIFFKLNKIQSTNYTISAYYFDVNNKLLKEEKKEKNKANINVKFQDYKSERSGIIYFNKNKNNFIYNLEFKHPNMTPISNKLSLLEQLQIYEEILDKFNFNIKKNDLLFDLFQDSKNYLNDNDGFFYFDFFLEILKVCFLQKKVINFLKEFNINKVKLPNKLNINYYSNFLNKFEKELNIINKNCNNIYNPDEYYKIFYTIYLFFQQHYEKEKLKDYLNKKDLWKYYIKIIPLNYTHFKLIQISNDFIENILNNYPLSFNVIKGTFFYVQSIESILNYINKYFEKIIECLNKENKKINLYEFKKPKITDILTNILKELEILINYELKKNQIIIIFDENLWNNYIYLFMKQNKDLILIKQGIELCKKVDKNLIFDFNSSIHKNVIKMINNGELKNEELLYYIKNIDIYFKEEIYASELYRPLSVFNGFDLNLVNDNFFQKWEEINILDIYSFSKNAVSKMIIQKVIHIKDFWKLIRIFNLKDYKLNKYIDKNLIELLLEKFEELIINYNYLLKQYNINKFSEEVSLLIYILDNKNLNVKSFLIDVIEKIPSTEIITNIYLYLSNNNENISEDIIDCITNYFTFDKNNLKSEYILDLIKKIKSEKILFSLFNKLDYFIIKEDKIFDEKEGIENFKLLEYIQKERYLEKYKILNDTKYIKNTYICGQNMLNNIKKKKLNIIL